MALMEERRSRFINAIVIMAPHPSSRQRKHERDEYDSSVTEERSILAPSISDSTSTTTFRRDKLSSKQPSYQYHLRSNACHGRSWYRLRLFLACAIVVCMGCVMIPRPRQWINMSNLITKMMNDEDQQRPTFVLHVGIPKTFTTFLQCTLCENPNVTEPILRLDNLVYLGTCPVVKSTHGRSRPPQYLAHLRSSFLEETANFTYNINARYCPENNSNAQKQPAFSFNPEFLDLLHDHYKKNHNVMVVFEDFAVVNPETLQRLSETLQKHWKVHILVAYRPLYQWLVSAHYEYDKYPSRSGWQGPYSHPYVPFSLHDTDSNSYSAISFRELERCPNTRHPTHVTRDLYAEYFDHVHVIPNLPTTSTKQQDQVVDPTLEYIFCQALATLTPRTCAAIRASVITGSHSKNALASIDADLLAVHAYEQGLFNSSHDRVAIRRAIQRYQQEHRRELSFPMNCPDEKMLNRLCRLSWNMEVASLTTRMVPSKQPPARCSMMPTLTRTAKSTVRSMSNKHWSRTHGDSSY